MGCFWASLSDIKGNCDVLTIYGAGKYAQILIEYFGEDEIEKYVDAFIVSEDTGNPKVLASKPVFMIRELPQALMGGTVIIAMSSSKYAEIVDS